jgi:hypothetical protein
MLVFLPALTRLLRPDATGARAAAWTPVFLLFAPFLLFDLSPGRVDHHGAQAVMAALGALGFAALMRGARPLAAAVASAAAIGCGLWIGTEALAWVLPLVAVMGLSAALSDADTRRRFALFGLLWPAATCVLLFIALPAPLQSPPALSWFSPAYAYLAAFGGAVFIAGHALTRACRPAARVGVYALLGLLAAAAFAACVPSIISGPFADYHSFNATTGLESISEAQPIHSRLIFDPHRPLSFAMSGLIIAKLLFLPLIAAFGSLWLARRAGNATTRILWAAQAFLIAAPLAVAFFWQARVDLFAQLFALAPLSVLFIEARKALALRLQNRRLFAAECLLLLALGPLPIVLLPAFAAKRPVFPDIALFPANRGKAACDLSPILLALNDSEGLGQTRHRILNTSNDGPQLLFATRHEIVAANYDAPGNPVAHAFFAATDEATARAALRASGADLILACSSLPQLYVGKTYFSLDRTQLTPGADGKLRLVNTDAQQPMIRRLTDGTAPAWLKPIEISAGSDYFLYAFNSSATD